jgi:hypothetical protein
MIPRGAAAARATSLRETAFLGISGHGGIGPPKAAMLFQ